MTLKEDSENVKKERYPGSGEDSDRVWRHVELRFTPEAWEWWQRQAEARGVSMGELMSPALSLWAFDEMIRRASEEVESELDNLEKESKEPRKGAE